MPMESAWPFLFSLALHLAVLSLCCVPRHTPEEHNGIMVDLKISYLAAAGSLAGNRSLRLGSGGSENALLESKGSAGEKRLSQSSKTPRGKKTLAVLPPAPVHPETRQLKAPLPGPATTGPEPKASPVHAPSEPVVKRGTDTGGAAGGKTAAAHGGGAGSGEAFHDGATGSGTGGGSGGGPGTKEGNGSTQPVDGVFGSRGGPSFIRKVSPVYPGFARRIGKEGAVLLRLTLDEGGVLKAVEIVEKAGYGFDEAAVTAVRASRYRPAMRHGRLVACRALLPIRFELKE